MGKTRILSIAPYEGMKTLIEQIASGYPGLELTAFVGDLEAGAAIAAQYSESDFDVIVSRGGTAELIRQTSPLPVVEIPLSVHDILRSIKMAESASNRFAIIGFPAITKNAHFLCDVLRYDIDIYTIHSEEEVKSALGRMSSQGYSMVLCDMITYSLARQYGILAILITSGAESVESALDQAVQTSTSYRLLTGRMFFYKSLLESQEFPIHVYGEDGKQIYSSAEEPLPEVVADKMAQSVPAVLEEKRKRLVCEWGTDQYVLQALRGELDSRPVAVYQVIRRKAPIALGKNGIRYVNREEAYDRFFNSFYGITQSSSPHNLTVDQYARSSQPLLIVGEVGTGKDQMVRLIYAKGSHCANPLVTVDCSRLREKGWAFLTSNENSPLNDGDATIHIKNSKLLSDAQFQELCAILKDQGVHRRNRLLFTCTYSEEAGMAERFRSLVDRFSCLTLFMPPLRSHKHEIPNLASLYISILNMRLAKEVIGFDPDALQALQAYDWPHNYDQFKRVVEELVTLTSTPYISLPAVNRQLKREMGLVHIKSAPAGRNISLEGTLEEINLEILRQVLAEERGNQSAAAKRLGLSRTTLWRMLQKAAPPKE